MIKPCARCGHDFDGYKTSKYCDKCKPEVYRELKKKAKERYLAKDPALIRHETTCTCVRCGENFIGHWTSKYCPDCKVIVLREQRTVTARRYRHNHPERVKPYQKEYRKKYYAEHRDYCKAYARQQYAEHRRKRILEAKKLRLRAKCQAIMVKREQAVQPKPQRHWTDELTLCRLSL